MSPASLEGRTVDRYDVHEQLGQGGFGAVYRARHRVVGNEVALKVLWPDHAADPAKVDRFMKEARAAASIGSPYIVRVLDAGLTEDGTAFLALERLVGHDLAHELAARGALPIDEAVAIVDELLEGLVAAHAAGIVHRDLKPGNLFLAQTEHGRRVKILDFGISKIIGHKTVTAAGTLLGTPQYMAPEQLAGTGLDARADLYAVGTILYELLAGRVPFQGSGYDVIVERLTGRRPPELASLAPHVPRALADVAMRALALDPDARWPSAAAMQDALRTAIRERALVVASAPTLPALARPVRSRPPPSDAAPLAPAASVAPRFALLGVLAVLLASGLGVLGVLGYRLATRPPPAIDGPPATNAIPVALPAEGVAVPVPVDVSAPDVPTPETPTLDAPTFDAPGAPTVANAVAFAPRWEVLHFAGAGARSTAESVIGAALPYAAHCAGHAPERVVVIAQFTDSTLQLTTADPSRRQNTRAAECVAQVIRRYGVDPTGTLGMGTITIAVELPAR
ncbi:MAG: protein kinase [Sandaracinaceae bacterium]|nr:protein kinase [Sandaracinaceae bacterium]